MLLVLGALVAPADQAGAQGMPVMTGRVSESDGSPIISARVEIVELGRVVRSDAGGGWVVAIDSIQLRRGGTLTIAVSQLGYKAQRVIVPLDGVPREVEILLEPLPVSLGEVQITAAPGQREPLAVAQSTTTISSRELERTMGATIGAALANQAGVATRWQGPAASSPVIRGMSGDRVLVLQDGVRSGDLASSAPDHAITVDPSAATRVELVRGPAALLYGNNAVGGVVNVISDDIPRWRPERASGSASFVVESGAPGGALSSEHLLAIGANALRVRAGIRLHDDVTAGRGWTDRRLANTQSRSEFAAVGVSRPADRGVTGVAVRSYRFDYGLPVPSDAQQDAVTLSGERHEIVARAEKDGRGGLVAAYRFDASAQSYSHDESFTDGSVGTSLAVRTLTGGASLRTGARSGLRDGAFGFGVYHRDNDVTGDQALTPPTGASGMGIYAFEERMLGAIRVPVGVRLDRFAISSRETERFGAVHSRAFTGLSGSIGVVAPLWRQASLAMTLARAVRSPTAEELFSQAGHTGTGAFEIGDPRLSAEITQGIDAVFRIERRGLALQLSAFATAVDGYIGLYPAGRDTVVADGAGGMKSLPLFVVSQRRASFRGFDGSLETVVAPHVILRLTADGVIARDAAGEPLPFIPAARGAMGLRYEGGRASAGFDARHALRQARVPEGELRAGAYSTVDLHGGVRMFAGGRAHSVNLRVSNATNALFRDASSRVKEFVPNPGRSIAVSYRLGY
jgi:iron complex outermembrane recepter protein